MSAVLKPVPLNYEACQKMATVKSMGAMQSAVDLVAHLDFTMLKRKLGQEKGWSPEHVAEVEDLYRKFLALNVVYPEMKICPTGPIDEFWHAHILDTAAYAKDCDLLFYGPLAHFPYFGMRGEEDAKALRDAFLASCVMFITHFGIDPRGGETEARGCSPQRCP